MPSSRVPRKPFCIPQAKSSKVGPGASPIQCKDRITFKFGAARRVNITQGLFYHLAPTFTGATSLEHHLRGLCQQLISESDYRLCACAANAILGSNLARLDLRGQPQSSLNRVLSLPQSALKGRSDPPPRDAFQKHKSPHTLAAIGPVSGSKTAGPVNVSGTPLDRVKVPRAWRESNGAFQHSDLNPLALQGRQKATFFVASLADLELSHS